MFIKNLFLTLSLLFTLNSFSTEPTKLLTDEVNYFKIGVFSEDISFEWKMNDEKGVKAYIIEYSLDGKTFKELDRKEKTASPNIDHVYETNISNTAINSENGYYRLKQVNDDGSIDFTEIKYFQFTEADKKDISITLHPNPDFKKRTTLRLEKLEDHELQVEITDTRGNRIESTTMDKGRNIITSSTMMLNNLELPKGLYFMTIYSTEQKIVRKFLLK